MTQTTPGAFALIENMASSSLNKNKEHDRSKSVNSIDDLAAKVDQLHKGNQIQVIIMEEATHEKSAGDLAFEAELSVDDQQEVSYVNGQGWQLKNYHPNPNVRNNQQIFWPKQDKPTDRAQSNQGQYAGYQKNYQPRKESEQQPADTPAVERNKEPAVGTISPGPEQPAEAVSPIPEVVPPREYIPKFPYPVPAKATLHFTIFNRWHTLSNQPRERERPARAGWDKGTAARYNALLRVDMLPTRFCHAETLADLGIDEDVFETLHAIGIAPLCYTTHELYPDLARQLNEIYETATEPKGVAVAKKFSPSNAFWDCIANGNFTPGKAYQSQIRNPAHRVIAKIISNLLFAKDLTSKVTNGELQTLYAGIEDEIQASGSSIPIQKVKTNPGFNFMTMICERRQCLMHGLNKKDRSGSLLTPLFKHFSIDLGKYSVNKEVQYLDIKYLMACHIMRDEETYNFFDKAGTQLFTKLPHPEITRFSGLVLVSEGKILRFELAELLGALLQLFGVFVELFLQDLELRGKLGIGLFPSSMQPGYLTLQIVDLPLEFGFSLGSFGFSLSEVFHFPEERDDPGTGPGKLHNVEPGFFLAGILGTGVPSSGDPEAGVLPGGPEEFNT
ncbi:hypothetical protein F2Q68_00038577 [Brassica cretica]|uniref:Arabidopsis retrotransposon Orf1 C-terminal domain-containing protein n=1 Tax=Brassica cretica TaxID=69181 RepID=A0A8S9MD39_BRACR|nr:hypothetical protein F2Q68_00038577 [Brassica cretica]